MNKREFVLGSCAGLLAAGSAVEAAPAASASGVGGMRLDERLGRPPELARDYSMVKWQHYVGHRFEVRANSAAQHLTLREIREAGHSGPKTEQFELRFSGNSGQALASGNLTLRHDTGQRLAIFLQAAGHSADGEALYSAHFNLLA